ncbi:MAG: iron ABC transporter permease [Firmicutes bacterium]|jgi:iron(III) transport system permease protein|nr:iron ABC transporter permease [Bacillota bacterium]
MGQGSAGHEKEIFTSTIHTQHQALRNVFSRASILIAVIALCAFFAVFILVPVGSILVESLFYQGTVTVSKFQQVLKVTFLRDVIRNSLVLASSVAIITTLVAFALAYSMSHVRVKGERFFQWVLMLPIVSPPFVIALAMMLLFGRNGLITAGLLGIRTSALYGLPGLVIAQTFALLPVSYMLILGALQSIDPSLEENAENLGASPLKVFLTITVPMATPGLAASLLVIFVQSIADIGNPLLIGGDFHVLAARVYFQLIGAYDKQGGAVLAVFLILPSLMAFLLQKLWVERRSYVSITGKTARARVRSNDKRVVCASTALCGLVSFVILLFYGMVFVGAFSKLWGIDYSFTLNNYKHVFYRLGAKPLIDTLQLAGIATPISGILGILVAYLLMRVKFVGQSILEFIALLSLAVPGVVLGIGYAIFFNKPPFLLSGTAAILVMAFVVRTMPIGIRAGMAGLQQIDVALEEASANLGANQFQTLKNVVLPLLRPAFFTGLLNSFVRSMTSVSAVVFLISAKWHLLTVSILAAVELGQLGVAAANASILIVITSGLVEFLKYALSNLGRTSADLVM